LRLYFALRPWDGVVNYTEDAMNDVQKKENTFIIFFSHVGQIMRKEKKISENRQKWNDKEIELHNFFLNSQTIVDNGFKNNFDTPTVISQLLLLAEKTTEYIKSSSLDVFPLPFLLEKISRFVTRILNILGLIPSNQFGYSLDSSLPVVDVVLDLIAELSIFPFFIFVFYLIFF
jgi:cysteinyl-tRNA synthetase